MDGLWIIMWYIYSFLIDDILDGFGGYDTEAEAWSVIRKKNWKVSNYDVVFKDEI